MNGGYIMGKWKKNAVAAAVLVTVCAGIYVNWLYSGEQAAANLTDTLDAEKVMSDDTLVLDQTLEAGVQDMENNTTTDYFAAVRLSRQEARDSAVNLLQEAMAYNTGEEAQQSNAQLEQIVQTALCEAQIESLVIAKGYTDCVAYMSEEGISVAVASPDGGMKQEDVAVIADIVITQTGFTMEAIRVVEVQ
jgi:stage III sporulation protein AH